MKVLWICNLIPARIAAALKQNEQQNKEGWVSSAMRKVIEHEEVELAVAFPRKSDDLLKGRFKGVRYYSFYEDTDHPEEYDTSLEGALGHICQEFMPDVIHCFGTEYPHTLAILKLSEWRKRVLVHMQGIMSRCAEVYEAGLPADVTERATFRDILRRDAIWQQKEKYEKRAEREKEIVSLAEYVSGRTAFDKDYVAELHPSCSYYAMNETLRTGFYHAQWIGSENGHAIFLSQGNIPLKGAHTAIEALSLVREKYPDAMLRVAGDNILRGSGLLERMKISGYGRYLRSLIARYHLEDAVHYLGQQTEREMLKDYQEADVCLLSSVMENSPNSLGEAMLLGMPCVACNVGGVASLAEHEKEVLLIPPLDAKAMAEALIRIFDDPGKASEMGAAARKHAALTHDAEANYKMLYWIYETIVKETGA